MADKTFIELIRSRHKLDEDTVVIVKSRAADVSLDEADSHLFSATISSDALDRDDEVLLPTGMDATEFMRSGPVAWNHDYDRPVAVPSSIKADGRNITAKASFMRRPKDYVGDFFPDFARAFVSQMVAAGMRPGVSVGFIPMESRNPSKKDIEQYGDQIRRVHSKWKLLEWSIAPVQSNPEAVVTAVGKGLIRRDIAKACCPPDMQLPETVTRRKLMIVMPEWQHKPKPKRAVDVNKMIEDAVADEIARRSGKLYR
jgi:hypothetical protein